MPAIGTADDITNESSYSVGGVADQTAGDPIQIYLVDSVTASQSCMTVFWWRAASNQGNIHLRESNLMYMNNGVLTTFDFDNSYVTNLDAGTSATTVVANATSTTLAMAAGMGFVVYSAIGDATNFKNDSASGATAITSGGRFEITANATFTTKTNSTINVTGDWKNSGIYTSSTHTVNLTGGSATITPGGTTVGAHSFSTLNISNTSGTKTLASNMRVGSSCTISDGGGSLTAGTFEIQLGANFSVNGAFVYDQSTVNFVGVSSQTVIQGVDASVLIFFNVTVTNTSITLFGPLNSGFSWDIRNNLTISDGPFRVAASTSLTVGNDVTIAAGACLNMSANATSAMFKGNYSCNNATHSLTVGFETAVNSTVTFQGSIIDSFQTRTINSGSADDGSEWPATIFDNDAGGTDWSLTTAANFNGVLTVAQGELSAAGGVAVTFQANLVSNGVFNSQLGAAHFEGTTSLSGSGSITLGNVSITGALSASAWTNLPVQGSWTNAGTFTPGTNTVTFSGNDANIAGGGLGATKAFYDVIFSAGDKTLLSDMEVNGDFTISGGSCDADTFAIRIAGDWTNSATFDPGTGTVTFDGADQSITSGGASGPFYRAASTGTGVKTFADDARIQNQLIGGTVAGFKINAGRIVTMSDNAIIVVGSGGMTFDGTDASASGTAANVVSTSAGVDTWTMRVDDNAVLNAQHARFSDGSIELNTNNPAEMVLADVRFIRLPAGVNAFIDLANMDGGSCQFAQLYFERGTAQPLTTARNIRAIIPNAPMVYVTGYSGDLAGETYDADEYNRIRWINNPTPLEVDDGVNPPTYVSSLEEALENAFSASLTIRANYDNAGQRAAAAAVYFGKAISLNDFNGTLTLDGFAFEQSANGEFVAELTGTSTGLIKFYNCMFKSYAGWGSTPALVDDGGGSLDIYFCTVDSTQADAGFTNDNDSIFAQEHDEDYFVNYAAGNLRLNKEGHDQIGGDTGTFPAGFEYDIDGRERTGTADPGCYFYGANGNVAAQYLALDDLTNGVAQSTESALIVEGQPAANSTGNCYYLSASDGQWCYISSVTRTDCSVQDTEYWSGTRAGRPTFVQTSDNANLFWVYVAYDSNGDGYYDRIRKLLHNKTTGFADDGEDVGTGSQLGGYNGDDDDILSDGGWDGNIFISNVFLTGVSEYQVAITTPKEGGEVHVYYVDPASNGGNFWADPDFATGEGTAVESYVSESGGFQINPNPSAAILVFGSHMGGHLTVVRTVTDAAIPGSGGIIRIVRDEGLHELDAAFIATNVPNFVEGPAVGYTFSSDPVAMTGAYQNRRYTAQTDDSTVVIFERDTFADTELEVGTVNAAAMGHAVPNGVSPKGGPGTGTTFVPLFDEDAGRGYVAAVEYVYEQDAFDGSDPGNDDEYELLGSAYVGMGGKITYDADPEGDDGGFDNGLAPFLGKPSAGLYSLGKRVFFLATEAGFFYAWDAAGTLATEDTSAKGAMISGYPLRVPGGCINSINFLIVNDPGIQAALGLPSQSATVLALTSDAGEMILVQQP